MHETTDHTGVQQQLVERACSLYTLPAVAVEILELTSADAVDTLALKRCVERDPAMTGKLLRVVNSSLFGLSREVSDLHQAIVLLGVQPLKLMVLGFSLPKSLFADVEARTLERFWRYSLLKAVAARELARSFWGRVADEAFIAGLLQELGTLVLVQQLGQPYVRFQDQVFQQRGDLLSLEQQTLGFDHTLLSARLLEHWTLPEQIVAAVASSHAPRQANGWVGQRPPLPSALHLATLIADMIVIGRTDLMAKLIEAAGDCGGIQLEQLQDLIEQLQHRVESLAEVFTVRLDQQQSYREVLEQAHQQMATVAVDALPEMLGAATCSLVDQQRQVSSALSQFQSRHTAAGQKTADEATQQASDSQTSKMVAVQPTADPGLLGRLAMAITACRRTRGEVSLALVEVDNYDGLLLSLGPDRVTDIVRSMETAIYANTDDQCDCLLATDSRYAVILPHCDRPRAVNATRWLLEEIPRWAEAHTGRSIDLHCSAGVATLATPGSNFPPQQLNAAAERCLFAAQASGGRLVKSIDLW